MSGKNGDKARFHRLRKQKLARRSRQRVMLTSASEQVATVSSRKSREKSA